LVICFLTGSSNGAAGTRDIGAISAASLTALTQRFCQLPSSDFGAADGNESVVETIRGRVDQGFDE
jgi:hypothetical protein